MLYDPATVEACAKVAEGTAPIARGNFFKARREQTAKIASAIRSLTAGREIHSSDGGVEGHARGIADSGRASVRGDNGAPESPHPTIAGIKPGPSEAIPSGTFRYGQYDAKVVDPALTQDCAPAGTVSIVTANDIADHLFNHADLTASASWRAARALLSQFDVRRK